MVKDNALGRLELKNLVLIFVTCISAYLLFWSGKHYSIDGIVMFEYAKALLFQHSFHLSPPIFWANQEIRISVWSLGLTLTYLPYLHVFSVLFPGNILYRQVPYDPHNPYNPLLLENSPYRYASLIHPLITALTAILVYALARKMGLSKNYALSAALIFGLASPAAPYAKYDYSQPLVSLLLIAAVVAYLWGRSKKPILMSLTGFLLGLTILTRPEMSVIAGVAFCFLVFWTQWREEYSRGEAWKHRFARLLSFAIPLFATLLLLLIANEQRFGSPFSTGFSSGSFNLDAYRMIAGVIGTIFSPARGILFFFPLTFLALLGTREFLHRDGQVGFLISWIIVASIILYSSWHDWAGGNSWGPRFLVPILPYLAFLAILGYEQLRSLSPAVAVVMFIVLLFLGWIANLQGQLFNSMAFVNNRTMFNLSSAPILSGWATILSPASYDIFWVEKIRAGQALGYLFPVLLFPLLGVLIYLWMRIDQANRRLS